VVCRVDRLGRNYDDVVEAIQCFMKRGIVIRTEIDGFTFDGATTDPSRRLCGTADRAESAKDAQRAGIATQRPTTPLPTAAASLRFHAGSLTKVQTLLAAGTMNVSEIGRHVGLQRMAVARIKADPAAAEAMLVNRGL
jgi:putative DNA-invertase from lambdoid prophage Rac